MSPSLSGVWLLPMVWVGGWIALRWLGVRMTGGRSLDLLRWDNASHPADHSGGDRGLVQAIVYSYGLRTLLAVSLYAISLLGWPILTSLQFHFEPGFWLFGLDSHLYNSYGHLMAQAWRQGTELPLIELGIEYFALVAVIYRLLGSNPLYPILLNCWLGAFIGLLVFRIGRRLFDPRTARVGALLVAFWPSSLLWSAQLLKDSLSWFLVFSAVELALRLAFEQRPIDRRGRVVWIFQWLGLVVTVGLVTRLRFYLGSALSLAAVLILVPRGCVLLMRRLPRTALSTAGVAMVVVASTLVARTLNPTTLLSPRTPELGHRRLAMASWEQGDLDEAAREFERALNVNQYDKPSYLGLAGVRVHQDRFDEALRVYMTYSALSDAREQAVVRRSIARSHLGLADHELQQGIIPSAMAGYERVLVLDSSVLSPYLYMGLMLTERGQFEAAQDMLQKVPASRAPADQKRLSLVQERLATKQRARLEEQRIHALLMLLQEDKERLWGADQEEWAAWELLKLTQIGQRLDNRLTALNEVTQISDTVEFSSQMKTLEGAIGLAVASVSPAFQRPSRNRLLESQRQGLGVFEFQGLGLIEPEGVREMAGDVLKQGLKEVGGAAINTVSETRPEELAFRRQGFVAAGGYSLTDAWAKISTPWGLLTYLPKALLNGLFAPFPWQWFDVKGSTGMMRLLAGAEMLAWYLLFPAVLWGSWGILTSRRADQLFLLTVVVSLLIPMALVVANLGTLYRLRLLFLLPLLIIAAAGDPRGRYEALAQWIKTWRTRRVTETRARIVGQPVTIPGNGAESLRSVKKL